MKRFSITILVTLLSIVNSYAANFYWLAIRYDNNWFDGRNWSHTPGGAAVGNVCGGCVGIDYPGSTDDVFIDASTSGQVSYASQGIQMRSMTWSGTANATSELYGYGSMTVSGSVVFVSNMKINASYINLYGSGGSDVFTTAGNDMKDCNVAIGSGTYALTGDYTSSTTLGKISVGGAFSTNNFNVTVNNVSASNASAIVFNMGSSVFTCVDFNMNYSPGSQTLTINPGTSTINYINLFYGGNKTFYSVVKVANSGVQDACLAGNFTNLTIKPGVNCSFSGGTSTTISNSLTVVGTAANRIALSNYGSGIFTLIDPNGSAMAYVDIVNGIAQNNGSANEFTTTNSTKTNCHGWDRVATPITFGSASKTYGASSFSMTASSASTGAFIYSIISGNSFASINASTGAVTILGAGAVTVQATQAGDIDYLPNSTTTSLTISKAPLTATTNAKSRIYGAANPTFDFTYSGFVNGETSAVLTTLPTGSCTAVATSGVGAYGIVGSGGSANNYSFTYSNAGSLTITPAPIVVTVNNASRAYGSANPTFSYSYSGFVNGDNASAFVLAFSAPTTGATTGSGVGSYAINAAGGNVGPNYSVAVTGGAVNSGTLTITKALLTATAANASRLYGSANPTFTVNYSGFVNGETASVITTQPTAATSAIATSPVGSYSITPSGGSATNYSFTYANGNLSVTPAPLTATTNAKSRIYGAANPTFDFTYSGFVNGETSAVLTTLPTGSCTAVATSGVGAYGIVGSGGSANNYSFTYSNAGSLTITPAPIVVTVNNASRAYGSANPTFSYSYSGFVNGDNASAFVLAFSAPTTGATTGSGVGSYAINAAGGNVGPNYSVAVTGGAVNSGTLTITKALLTATAANASRLYGSANPTFTVNYSGFVNGETASVITTQSTAATSAIATSSVGSYSIVPSGGSATNYSFTYANGSLSITKAPLTVTANNKSRAYGAANPIFDFTFTGFANGETATVLTTIPTASTSAITTSGVGSYLIVPSGGAATNYSFSYSNGSLSITQASLTVTANDKSRIYGAANPTFDFTYTGFANGETATVLTTTPTAFTSAIATSGVGSYSIVPSGGSATNYSFAYSNGSLSITKTSLTVTANDKNRAYGAANPTFDFTYSGFANGETATVLTTTPTASTSAIATSGVGSYSIVPSGGSATNYSFTYSSGNLSIIQAPLIVTANNATRAYGDANPVFTMSYSGFVNGDDASVFTAPPTAVTSATTQSNTGTYSITASGGVAANYSFGTYQSGTLTINQADQTITFGALAPVSITSAPVALTGSSSSGLSVTYSSSDASVATIIGSTITIVGIGTSTITASQAGDTNYNPASPIDRTLTVNNLLSQTITFGALAPVTFGTAPFTLNAVSSNSTIPVTYSSSNSLVATVNGNTVTVVAAGTATIKASQAGDANYNPASDVGQTLIVNPASQTIAFGALAPVTFGATPFTLNATSSSGLSVSYSSSNTSVATVSGNTIIIVGAGNTTITASQAGNTNYSAAPNVDETLTVKLSQTITFNPIQAIAVTHVPFDLNTYASSDAGLALTYSSSELTVATVSGSTVTIVGPGTTTITASQAGNGTYAPAASAQRDLTVFSKVLGFSGASVVGDTLAFGNVVVGLTSTLKFTLTNSGTAALSISGITYPSGFSGDKTNGIISVGGTMDVNVIYTPSTLLAIKEAIVFASDATSGNGQLFVTGTGTKITGFEETPSQFSVYPNPGTGLFTIEGIDNSQQNLPIEIVDASGRSVGYFPLSNSGKGKFQLDITTASDGLYLVRIQGKNAVRIIKK